MDKDAYLHDVDIENPDFDLDQNIKNKYHLYKQGRESKKILFSIFTLGIGALYLWSNTKIVKNGMVGIRITRDGQSVILPPGRHSNLPGEAFGLFQSLSQPDVTVGTYRIVTITDGYRGESYKQGKLIVLTPGRYLLDPQHTLSNRIHMGDDIIKLGPKTIVTVKAGMVGICYKKGILNLLEEGRHEITLPDETWQGFLSLRQEIVELPSLNIKTTDNINVTCHAVLAYRIFDPVKAITGVDNLRDKIINLAELSLSTILRRFSFRDLSPVPADEEEDTEVKEDTKRTYIGSKIQAKLHDEVHEAFENTVNKWGVELIGPVQIKTVNPADKMLRDAIANDAINVAKADAQRRQAEFKKQVKYTNAQAGKETDIVKAEGNAEIQMILSRGNQQAQILKAQGDAEAIRIISQANLEATQNEAKGAEALMSSPIAQKLAILDKQAETLAICNTPVYVPNADLGDNNIWTIKQEDTNPQTKTFSQPPVQNTTITKSILINLLVNK